MNLEKTAYLFIIGIASVVTLIYGQSILVAFILGALLWFIGRELIAMLDKISFIKNYFPNWIKQILSIAIIISVLVLITEVLTSNINHLAQSLDQYQPNVDTIISQLNEFSHLDIQERLKEYTGKMDFSGMLKLLFASIYSIIGNGFMIVLYFVFILLEEANFRPKLYAIFAEEQEHQKVDTLLNKIEGSISNYLKLKTLLSLVTGVLSYFVLWLIGVDAPAFWAFLIFILNFIPTIGSLIGTIFPAIFCLLQFGTFLPAILVLSIVGVIQLFVGNFLEPKLMGSSMNISPLVTVLALSIWGAIWGITGMILSVPITVVAIIILSQFEGTKSAAILLSEKGEIS